MPSLTPTFALKYDIFIKCGGNMQLKDQDKILKKVKAIQMPEFEATLVDGQQKVTLNLPISDHEILVANTAIGVLVTLNIWCPGSRLAPSKNPQNLKGQFRVTDVKQQRVQLKLLAKYIFDLAKAGVSGFMLQEIPLAETGDGNFDFLNDELQKLCAKNKKINLEFRCIRKTKNMNSGTCALVNTQKLLAKDKTPAVQKNDPMYQRFARYELQTVGNTSVQKCHINNVHGDYAEQAAVKQFIKDKVDAGEMVCGDFNLTENNKPEIEDSPYNQVYQGELNTLDGFYDPLTPSLEASGKPKKTVKKAPKNDFNDILKTSSAEILDYMKWTASPKIKTSDIDSFKASKSKVKNLSFSTLSENEDLKRALFNLAFYSSKVKNSKKKTALLALLNNLSKNPEDAENIIVKALKNKVLVKNTKFGFYKFFHSGFKNKELNNRWSRSTTEQLLIETQIALKNASTSEDNSELRMGSNRASSKNP